ncbi:hypothetical protein A0H81_13598 [Grifola frondosa]|uniref:Uncharacterized protein n=1 Tax=Grifola frondosa TaxID=5627 RepID=A0A1C7LQW8_GRIFR|nr:hypothetical protein A0H81_13598 [Grifola frondosa]
MPRPSPPSYADNIQCYPSGSNYPISDVLDWSGYTNNCIKKEKCGSTLTLKEVVVMVAKQFGNFYSNAKRGQITQAYTTYRGWDLLNGKSRETPSGSSELIFTVSTRKTQTYGPSEDIALKPRLAHLIKKPLRTSVRHQSAAYDQALDQVSV